jgi:hypothetical protein
MGRVLLLLLVVLVSVDLTTLDAPRLFAGGRAVQWDDEEESAPSRRPSAGAKERRLVESTPAPHSIERPEPEPRVARRVPAESPPRPTAWLLPIRQAVGASLASASPAEDH